MNYGRLMIKKFPLLEYEITFRMISTKQIKSIWRTESIEFDRINQIYNTFHLRVPVFDVEYKFEFFIRLKNTLLQKRMKYSKKQTIIILTSSPSIIYNIDFMINQSESFLYNDGKSYYSKWICINENL